jgi:hypothetical protein
VAAVVEAAESEAVTGAARKAARRALNVLRSRGVAIPARVKPARAEARVEQAIEASLTPPDMLGTIVLTFTRRDPSGRYFLGEVVLREPYGILQAGAGWLSLNQIKDYNKRSAEGSGLLPVSVPVEWARHRIAAARKLNATSGVVLPLALERCTELIEPAPEAEPPHPLADLEVDITSDRATAAALLSAHLLAEPEFRGWHPDQPALDELIQKVGQRLGPLGSGEQVDVQEVLKDEMNAAVDRFFSPEVRSAVSARMRDAAISLRARKGDRAATEVLATARAVREAGLITSPPRDIPFLVGFFQTGLGYLAQKGGGRLSVPREAPSPEPSEAAG